MKPFDEVILLEMENSNENMSVFEIEDIEEQNISIDKPISAECDTQSSLNEEDIVNDDFEASIENFENIEDDQNLINNHDDRNDELIKC